MTVFFDARSFFVFDHTPVRQPLDDRVGSGLGPVQLLLAQPGKLRAFDGLVLTPYCPPRPKHIT